MLHLFARTSNIWLSISYGEGQNNQNSTLTSSQKQAAAFSHYKVVIKLLNSLNVLFYRFHKQNFAQQLNFHQFRPEYTDTCDASIILQILPQLCRLAIKQKLPLSQRRVLYGRFSRNSMETIRRPVEGEPKLCRGTAITLRRVLYGGLVAECRHTAVKSLVVDDEVVCDNELVLRIPRQQRTLNLLLNHVTFLDKNTNIGSVLIISLDLKFLVNVLSFRIFWVTD